MKIKSQNTKVKMKFVGSDVIVCPKQERNTRLQNSKHKELNTEQGITLVALIITIIVLLILAIVSIRLVMNDGIIGKAEYGRNQYEDGEIRERIALAYKEYEMSQFDSQPISFQQALTSAGLEGATISEDGKTVTYKGKEYPVSLTGDIGEGVKTLPTVTANVLPAENYPVEENSKYISDGKVAIIPSGYSISNDPLEQSINNGLVIKKNGNEWVWIPVNDIDFGKMFGTASDDGWILCENTVKTKYKSNERTDIRNDLARTTPGTTTSPFCREPDVLTGSDDQGTLLDNNPSNTSVAGLGSSIKDMAVNLRDDYKNMMDSVKKYGGFYVGRFELSNAGTKKNQETLCSKTWYEFYAICKEMDNSGVQTRMIWGCQWDQICDFIRTAKDKNGAVINLADSRKYGNYWNSQNPGNTGGYAQNTRKNTGSNEAWKTNNIYDLAGNLWEWTQEPFDALARAFRGGSYGYDGDSYPVAKRNAGYPTLPSYIVTTRPVLYINT